MQIVIDNKSYNVNVIRKKVKYLRVIFKDNEFYITTNYLTNDSYILNFLNKNLKKISMLVNNDNHFKLNDGMVVKIMNDYYKIVFDKYTTITDNNEIHLYYKNPETHFYRLLKYKLMSYLDIKLKYYYNLIYNNDNYPTYNIKKVKSYFGICYISKRHINFNLSLALYDLDVIDSVIVHELCHLRYNNHGKDFYNLIYKFIPNYKSIVAKRKKEKIML